MDALSSSVSSALKVSATTTLQPNSSTRDFYHSKKSLQQPNTTYSISGSRRTSISTTSRRSSFTHTTTVSSVRRRPSPPRVHQRAATGYAAALLDIAQCNSALEAVEKDVRRFSRLLKNRQLRAVLDDPGTAEAEKGRVVKEVAERGRFHKRVVGMVKMLVEKKKAVELVAEVMEEFERIYDEMTGTRVVLVPVNNLVARRIQSSDTPSFAY